MVRKIFDDLFLACGAYRRFFIADFYRRFFIADFSTIAVTAAAFLKLKRKGYALRFKIFYDDRVCPALAVPYGKNAGYSAASPLSYIYQVEHL